MELYTDITVSCISVIVKKRENIDFSFTCESRSDDGIMIITEGEALFTENGTSVKIGKNTILAFHKGQKYKIEALTAPLEYITTAFSLNPSRAFRLLGIPTVVSAVQYPYISDGFEKMLKAFESRSPLYIMETRIAIEQLLCDIITVNQRSDNPDSEKLRLTPAINCISTDYDKKLSVRELASMCTLSEAHFRRLFKSHTGMSPMQYRESVRLMWAERMLTSRMFSVTEIAERLGYSDVYHFSKAMKRSCGVSPTCFKKSNMIEKYK